MEELSNSPRLQSYSVEEVRFKSKAVWLQNLKHLVIGLSWEGESVVREANSGCCHFNRKLYVQ